MSRNGFAVFALSVGAFACHPSSAPSPNAESGAFVVRLGNDTVGVDRYTRVGNRIEGDFLQHAPRAIVTHYVITVDAAGMPTRYEIAQRLPDGSIVPNGARGSTVTFTADSTITQIQRDSVITRRVAVRNAFPYINFAVSLFQLPVSALRASNRDSASYAVVGAAGAAPTPIWVVRKGTNRYWVFVFGYYEVITNDNGLVESVDGARTTQHIYARRQASADVAAIATMFAERERQTRAMGILSPRDTVNATVGSAKLWVDYGRPSARGRQVFGANGVLGDTIWRTGANAATQFRTDVPLTMASQTIPAGTYTLWTLARPGRYQLIINKQVGQWGTEYKPEQDLARVPLQSSALAQPVDRFTITVEPTGGNAGVLKLRWDTTELAIPFTTP